MNQRRAIDLLSDDPRVMLPSDLTRQGRALRANYLDGRTETFRDAQEFVEVHRVDLSRQSPDALSAFAEFLGLSWRPTHVIEYRLPDAAPSSAPDMVEVVEFIAEDARGNGTARSLDDVVGGFAPTWTVRDGQWSAPSIFYPGGGSQVATVRVLHDGPWRGATLRNPGAIEQRVEL